MAGGPAFLHDEKDLTMRLCYVNFDGKNAVTGYINYVFLKVKIQIPGYIKAHKLYLLIDLSFKKQRN